MMEEEAEEAGVLDGVHGNHHSGEPWVVLESAESRVAVPSVSVAAEPSPSAFGRHLYTVSYLAFFSIFGTLARIGLQALTFYPGAPVVTGVLWANVGGSLVMGFIAQDRNLFAGRQNQKREDGEGDRKILDKAIKKTIPLYIGLTTGFCGSFTSFSAFMLDSFLAMSNELPSPDSAVSAPRHGGYSFMAVVAVIFCTIALSLCALVFGAHLADALDAYTPTIGSASARRILDPIFVLLGLGCWLGSVLLAIWPPDPDWRGRAVFAVVFAPVGTLMRFYISIPLNTRTSSFPLGTFVVNILGTMVLGMCFDLQRAGQAIGMDNVIGCQVLTGVMDGFCGCLTTVSTWVAELHALKRRHAYRYGVASIGLGLAMLVVIVGSMTWSIRMNIPVCLP
jgi:fluoride ion exporter CrcB/FEX